MTRPSAQSVVTRSAERSSARMPSGKVRACSSRSSRARAGSPIRSAWSARRKSCVSAPKVGSAPPRPAADAFGEASREDGACARGVVGEAIRTETGSVPEGALELESAMVPGEGMGVAAAVASTCGGASTGSAVGAAGAWWDPRYIDPPPAPAAASRSPAATHLAAMAAVAPEAPATAVPVAPAVAALTVVAVVAPTIAPAASPSRAVSARSIRAQSSDDASNSSRAALRRARASGLMAFIGASLWRERGRARRRMPVAQGAGENRPC